MSFIHRHPLIAAAGAGVVGGFPVQPLVIQDDRFTAGGNPEVLTSNFLAEFATDNFSHIYLADVLSAGDRTTLLNTTINAGYNSFNIYLLNQNDYNTTGSKFVSPYNTADFSAGWELSGFDAAKEPDWKAKIEAILNLGIRPILWLRADDSPAIDALTEAQFKAFIDEMLDWFDAYPIAWVLGLEVNDYYSLSNSNLYGAYLKANATKPVGVHTRSGSVTPVSVDFMTPSWVDFAMAQEIRTEPWETHYAWVKSVKTAMAGRPVLWAEYRQNATGFETSLESRRFSVAGMFAGAAGYGNGGPAGLAELIQGLPNGMVSTRSGTTLTLEGGSPLVTARATIPTSGEPTFAIVEPTEPGDAPTFDGLALNYQNMNNNQRTVNINGVADDDMVAWAVGNASGFVPDSVTASGVTWIEILPTTAHANAPNFKIRMWRARLTAPISSVVFNATNGGDEWGCGVCRIKGANASDPLDVPLAFPGTTNTGPNMTCPALTTISPDCLILRFGFGTQNVVAIDENYPDGTTGRFLRDLLGAENLMASGLATHVKTTAGNVGTAQFSNALLGTPRSIKVTMAIKP